MSVRRPIERFRRPAERRAEQQVAQLRGGGDVGGHGRHVDERVASRRGFPIDQPQPVAVEEEVLVVRVVVAGDERVGLPRVGGPDPLEAVPMGVQEPWCHPAGALEKGEHPGGPVEAVPMSLEGRRLVQPCEQQARVPGRPRRPSGVLRQRPLGDEAHHHDARLGIEVSHRRGDARVRRDAHALVLVRVPHGVRHHLDANQVRAVRCVNPIREGAGPAARDRGHRSRSRPEHRIHHRAHEGSVLLGNDRQIEHGHSPPPWTQKIEGE